MRESEAAKTALTDYLTMGPGRSLDGLAQRYCKHTESRPPTRLPSTLKKWSVAFNWQDRVAAYEEGERQKVLVAESERREKARQESLVLVRGAKARAAEDVSKGGSFAVRKSADLRDLVELEMALLGEPLSRRVEYEHSGEVTINQVSERTPEELAAYHERRAARLRGLDEGCPE